MTIFRSRADPLGLYPRDPVRLWADAEQRAEEARAEERRREQVREEQRRAAAAANEAAQLRAAFEARLDVVEQWVRAFDRTITAVDQDIAALKERNTDFAASLEGLIDSTRRAAEGFNAIADEQQAAEPRGGDFQFAQERRAPTDLPVFLPRRSSVN